MYAHSACTNLLIRTARHRGPKARDISKGGQAAHAPCLRGPRASTLPASTAVRHACRHVPACNTHPRNAHEVGVRAWAVAAAHHGMVLQGRLR